MTALPEQQTAWRMSHPGRSFRLAPTLCRDRLASLDRQRLWILVAHRLPANDHHNRPPLLTTPQRIAPRDAIHDLLRHDPRPFPDLPLSPRHDGGD
jgi:hypothetical protein